MAEESVFSSRIRTKVVEQLKSQKVGYLLGAGSSFLDNNGYPLASQLWELIKDRISDTQKRADIQAKLDNGARGIENALDLLDDGGVVDTPYRHLVTEAIESLFRSREPILDYHKKFVQRLSQRGEPGVKIFSLNYDPLIERAAERVKIRIVDGFYGMEHSFFDPALFEERIGRIRGTYKGRLMDETAKPLHLIKLHGSLGWYECPIIGVRRCSYGIELPSNTKRLMIPPQRRKANDTLYPPYSYLWSSFRGYLVHNDNPINRLACFGYSFADEHVNAVIEAALSRTDFTLLIFAKELSDDTWRRWSNKANVIIVTSTRCSNKGLLGPGETNLWRFEHLCDEV